MILYHGTSQDNVESIRQKGIRLHREIPDESSLAARISLTDSFEEAREWGDGTVVTVDVPQRLVHKMFGDVPSYSMREYHTYRTIPLSQIVQITYEKPMYEDTGPNTRVVVEHGRARIESTDR